MSIFPSIDLVIDVGRAADPSRKAEALKRLERISSSTSASASIPFALNPTNLSTRNLLSFHSPKQQISTPPGASPDFQDNQVAAFRKFEAFILQTWLDVLLPKAGFGAYGNDQAGGLWRSLMAEQLGEQLSKNDSFGIERLAHHGAEHANEASIRNKIDFAMKTDKS